MKKYYPAVLVFSLMFLIASALAGESEDWKSLVAAERAFAKSAVDNGIRSAFLANLAGGALVFRPEPTPGRPFYEKLSPDLSTRLIWKPEFAEISASGDLGYTTGPYELFKDKTVKKASGYGHYVTIWKKQGGGEWKAVLDIGVSHPAPRPSGNEVQAPSEETTPSGSLVSGFELEQEKQKLRTEEAAFARRSVSEGTAKAYAAFASERIRVYREGNLPVAGLKSAQNWFARVASPSSWSSEGADVSASNDLGYAYGTGRLSVAGDAAGTKERLFSFMHLWHRDVDRKWRVVLDIAIPYPSK